ncbi:hypothetical protein Tco_0916298 [Tanacetum coccineum]
MEEDSKVPLILRRPFLHTADAVIRVKQKQLNLGAGTERMIFHIDFSMKHSYSNNDTCFSIDVIDKILEEDFDALLDEGSEILHSIKGTILKEKLFAEFDEFTAIIANENSKSESDTKEPPFEKFTFNTNYKIKTSLEELPTDLELKPLPDNLECMLAIFHDMIEEFVEVFMDDFSIFRSSFGHCLNNLNKMLQRCKDAHLVLNWEKWDFMVKEGIMLGHKVSEAGLEVDKAKIEVISKLPPSTNIKEFDIKIKDRKGTENAAVDHLSRIKNDETSDDSEVDDNFPGDALMEINTEDEPWFADFANYLVSDIIPKGMTYQQKNKFFSDLKHYFWEEPYLFKVCSDGMIRRCVSGPETQTILDQCHHGPTGGHYGPNTTAKKLLNSGNIAQIWKIMEYAQG